MKGIEDTNRELPRLKNDRKMYVYLQGSHFQQNNVIGTPNNNNIINIYVVYKFDPIASSRDHTFTIQNALFGAMQITKNALILENIITKDMAYVLMKEGRLVIREMKVVLLILQTLETF